MTGPRFVAGCAALVVVVSVYGAVDYVVRARRWRRGAALRGESDD